eukprot:TRINITY_DN1671_c0_g1_i1.p1 TRINITY_DN1671_c0_g1~~TRINITY_DN1671_c0_g1_i1.p1  ORF type:complete len:193 (+),score=24.52 TRINITY_DN1671_c0_g1_i1:42-581(+)
MDVSFSSSRPSEWLIGVLVRIKTTLGEDIEGEIFSYDTTTNTVILQETSTLSSTRKNFRILKTSFVKEVQVLSKNGAVDTFPDLPSVNIYRIKSREEQVIMMQRQRLGIGVTPEAQDVFNALARTLPCRWGANNEIIVFDDVRIVSPYSIENLSGGTLASLERVKKVLEGRKKKQGSHS